MSTCPACGSLVDASAKSCPNCGKILKKTTAEQPPIVSGLKPTMILVNGILVGAGLAVLIAGVIGTVSLNNARNQIGDALRIIMMPPGSIEFTLRDFTSLISVGVFGAVIGAYMLIGGLLSQFSRTARQTWETNSPRGRVANGLMSAGALLASLSAANVVRQTYSFNFGWFGWTSAVVAVAGVVLFAVGVILLLKGKAARNQR